jgi:hypothetical protein
LEPKSDGKGLLKERECERRDWEGCDAEGDMLGA